MGRLNKTGIRGLYHETVKDKATGEEVERWSIDLRYRDAEGHWKRYRERLPDGIKASAAKARAQDIINSATAGKLEVEQREPKTLGAALDAVVKWAETNCPASLGTRKTNVAALKAGLGESTKVADLAPFAVERFKRDRINGILAVPTKKGPRARKVAPATINRSLATLKHACGLWAEWGWMRETIAIAICKVKLLKEPEGRVRVMAPEEEAALLRVLPKQVIQIMGAATLTGMRRSEIARLKKTAVDLTAREITVVKSKSGKVRRIPINDDLVPILQGAMAQSPSEYVFTNRKGLPYHPDSLTHAFTRACKKAKLVDLRLHDCRHTFATWLRRGGADLDIVQKLLGHATIAMTTRYAHVGKQELHAAVARIGTQRFTQHNGGEAPTEEEKDDDKQAVK